MYIKTMFHPIQEIPFPTITICPQGYNIYGYAERYQFFSDKHKLRHTWGQFHQTLSAKQKDAGTWSLTKNSLFNFTN